MAADPLKTLVALNRFGLGARPGDAAKAAADPRGFVRDQIVRPVAALDASLMPGDAALRAMRMVELGREADRTRVASLAPAAQPAAGMGGGMSGGMSGGMADGGGMASGMAGSPKTAAPMQGPVKPPPPPEVALFRAEAAARFGRLATSDNALVERLVMFWTNHFAVSTGKGNTLRVLAGPFEREAIRPHVLGRFADMLRAVEMHPAMLIYLDNQMSVGPNSRAGRNRNRGLNENLAREILELHTLGVDGGYTQADVTAFANVLTGWIFSAPDEDAIYGGRFTFAPVRHEPGPQTVLGRVYSGEGVEQGGAVLDDLARHPSTARFIARKLARHFVADDPPPALVERLAKVFSDSDGDLDAVTRALVDAPEAWAAPLTKMRTPLDFAVAGMRATGRVPEVQVVLGALNAMGQPLWNPPGPNGWPDRADAWATAEGMDSRLDVAAQWGKMNGNLNPNEVLDAVLGAAASPETRQAVSRAESRVQGLAILMMSPEFQRR